MFCPSPSVRTNGDYYCGNEIVSILPSIVHSEVSKYRSFKDITGGDRPCIIDDVFVLKQMFQKRRTYYLEIY